MMEKVIAALSEPRRRDILQLIQGGELASGDIASRFAVTAPAISQHLKVLEDCGLVAVRRAGTKRYYRVRREGFEELRMYIDRFWDDSLLRLKEEAELEERRTHGSDEHGSRN